MKEKDTAEAKAVLEGRGLINNSDTDEKKSKSSNMILFGDEKEMKRNQKRNEKDELK